VKISDEAIISAVLTCETIKKAAEACGLCESQLYKRMRTDGFKAKYSRVKDQMLDSVTSTMQNGMKEAACTMIKIMRDPSIAPQTRLNAADSILRNGMKLTEQNEILQRLEKLEDLNDE